MAGQSVFYRSVAIMITIFFLSAPFQHVSSSTQEEVRAIDRSLDTKVDGSLWYLADHPDEMEELGVYPAKDGFIRVLIQLDSLKGIHHEFVEDLGGEVTDSWKRFDTLAAMVPLDSLNRLVEIPDLEWVEPSVMLYPMLASSVPAIGGSDVHEDYDLQGENTTIAILDTGINGDHEYLDDLDDDNSTNDTKIIGFYDARSGQRNETDPEDTHNHGSHVAGIAAGTGGPDGINVGMAPQALLVGVIVLDGGGGTMDDILEGINWTLENKDRFSIDVMSLSLGGPIVIPGATNDGNSAVSRALDDAVDEGLVTIVAVGNGNAGVAAHAGSVTFPADSRRAITVGWVNDNGNRVISSSRGPTGDGRIKPDVMAPGSGIESARGQENTGSSSQSGSSMSAPHVAGLAALMLQANPYLVPDEDIDPVKQILHETSRHEWGDSPDPYEPYSPNNQYGWGTVDSVGAVQRAMDLLGGFVDAVSAIPLSSNSTFEFSLNYTKTNYTYQGQNGDSHGPPLGSTAPDVVNIEIRYSSDWPEPTDIVGTANEASGLTATVEPANITANETGDEWVIRAYYNYTGDGSSGTMWTSYPTLEFSLNTPDETDLIDITCNYTINNMSGQGSSHWVDSAGDLPDMTIIDLDVDDDDPVDGEIITFTAEVENIGAGLARDGTVTFYDGDPDDNGTELGSAMFTDIASGGTEDVDIDWNTSGEIGEHEVYARITSVSPTDDDLDNNDAGPLDLEVHEKGTITNEPPEITIEYPVEDQAVEGVVTIFGYVEDVDDDVESVEVSIDDDTFTNGTIDVDLDDGYDRRWNWSAEWDTDGYDFGDHYIHVMATDESGDDDVVELLVRIYNDPPKIDLTVLTDEDEEAYQSDEFTIEWTASDPDDDASIMLFRDTNDIYDDGDETEEVMIAKDLSEDDDDEYEWDLSDVPLGEYYLYAVIDDGYNIAVVDHTEYTLTIIEEGDNERPEVDITDPEDDDTVMSTVNVTGTSSDADGDVDSVEIRFGKGSWKSCEDASSGSAWSKWYYIWDTATEDDGKIDIEVRATDDQGSTVKNEISVTVDNPDHERPTILIGAPYAGSGPYADNVTLLGSSNGTDYDVDRVEVSIDDEVFSSPQVASGTDIWTIKLDLSTLSLGGHTIHARAIDEEGLASETASIIIKVDNRVPEATIESVSPEITDIKGTFRFRGSGDNGDIEEHEWSHKDLGVLGDKETLKVDAVDLGVGEHVIRYRVMGANGLWSDFDTATIEVTSSKKGSDDKEGMSSTVMWGGLIGVILLVIIAAVMLSGRSGGGGYGAPLEVQAVEVVESSPEQAAPSSACPTCGGAPIYYPQYGRYFCQTCQQYL